MTDDSIAAPQIAFALVLHNHQPVGNFGWVFEDVYRAAYRPLVDLLLRHPAVRVGLHYSGPLLQWFAAEHPEFLDDVRSLVARGQVEILGGGMYEPVLASLPERDRVGQLVRMADELERVFGARPHGAWLAERVWEPSLPTSLVDGGYHWTILDDVHLRAAAIPDEAQWGTYTTDDQGRRLTIFPTEQGLRYLIPFQPVADVIAHLRAHATADGTRLGTMGDDGEKFGAWPTTYEHCWGRGNWMEEFFTALEENARWLTTVRPSDWTAAHPPLGRVYVPTSSYVEMTEWALPPADAIEFENALARGRAARAPEANFLRGGFWRNFQRRYREINDLHKQMLRASAAVEAMAPGRARDLAVDHLYQGQSNDCYWHGLFGGIYISHMRLASFEHVIAAEDLAQGAETNGADTGAAATTSRRADVDIDGIDEVVFDGPGEFVQVKLDAGAAIAEWSARAPRHALTAVLRRRPEASHERLRAAAAEGRLKIVAPEAAVDEDAGNDGRAVESIHELVQAHESGLERLLIYDAHERRSGLVHLYNADATADDVAMSRATDRAAVVDSAYTLVERSDNSVSARCNALASVDDAGSQAIAVSKTITVRGDRRNPTLSLDVRVENHSDRPLEGRLAVEWNLTFLGGGGNPAAFYEIGGERLPHDSRGERDDLTSVVSGNTDIGVFLATDVHPAATTWWYPIETISNSESGFERVYQGSSLVFSWRISLGAGQRIDVEVRNVLEATRDRAAEELATS